MRRPTDARKTAGTLASFGLAGVVAAAAVWYCYAPAGAPAVRARSTASTAAGAPPAAPVRVGAVASTPPLPGALDGTVAPRLPVDADGHLRRARGVRNFFDYVLTAQNELSAAALDTLVRKQIAIQLDGTTAQLEALDAWQRYAAYRAGLSKLVPLSPPARAGGLNLDAMRASLDARISLASRTLGPQWSEAFFGADWRRGRYTIERLRIMRDSALTEAQKNARLQALAQSLPPEERAAREVRQRASAALDTVAKLQREGGTVDELRAKATQALGPQAAERLVALQRDDDAWQAKYADYAAQRARIDAMGLSSAERDAQVDQLRRRVFSNSAQALRAASLDQTPSR